jgi:death on curing protein
MTAYLSAADVLALHAAYLEARGHAPRGLRDLNLLESALARPQMAAHYEGADLVRQAALLGAGIIQNHPWRDGNKRGAYIAIVNFLDQNGLAVQLPGGDPLALAFELQEVARGRESGESLADESASLEAWLRAHTAPREEEESLS